MKTATTQVTTVGINGMTCGSCERRVENALRDIPGVVNASVDLASGTASIRFEPSRIRPGAIAQAVREAGYEVAPSGMAARAPARRSCCS